MSQESVIRAELAVVGAGAAGLYAGLCAAAQGARVALVSATTLAQTASYWAQGGLAAALAAGDSAELHREDTERAGRGLVRASAAAMLCAEAPERVAELERLGVNFDRDLGGALSLGLEGGHSRRRVVHSGGSATGRRVVRQLSALAAQEPMIEVLEHARADKLLLTDGRCVGVACEDGREIRARGVVICAGGAAALWARTTNPPGSLGSGMLLAHRAGAQLADLEFLQFHPTAVIGLKGREGFLVTEAIRGEGALLLGPDGERFVEELLPRDEVSRAIYELLGRTGATSVSLDMRMVDPTLFPNVVGALADAGLDVTRELVPVAPAAHYMMGGITTDLEARSTLPGLYAVGESACTGLHGANRLASNSLSECFVFGRRAALSALSEPAAPPDAAATVVEVDAHVEEATRTALWELAGLSRTRAGLEALAADEHPLARLIAACALGREESRGAHQRSDRGALDPRLDGLHTIVDPAGEVHFERWD
ncbi:MAG TPA: FAD-dependent oxidoreductase [Solirubrobacteraceae bacterium]|jgi:L-aspartate oxidase|nr:FAD-dependent oxidoreductase [Solirubrobacteraceae bacterium]